MARDGFKVVIVGGSITGLTLANILERVGIDYVLLEAYPDIAPLIGASIILAAHGLRILDQIGAYAALEALPGAATENVSFWLNEDRLRHFPDFDLHYKSRQVSLSIFSQP